MDTTRTAFANICIQIVKDLMRPFKDLSLSDWKAFANECAVRVWRDPEQMCNESVSQPMMYLIHKVLISESVYKFVNVAEELGIPEEIQAQVYNDIIPSASLEMRFIPIELLLIPVDLPDEYTWTHFEPVQ